MKYVVVIETDDGSRFDNTTDVKKYLDNKCGDEILRIAKKLCAHDVKYVDMIEILNSELENLSKAYEYRKECEGSIEPIEREYD